MRIFIATENHICTIAQMLKNIYALYLKLPSIFLILIVKTINLIDHKINYIVQYNYF